MNTVEVRLYASLRKYYPEPRTGEALTITLDDKAKLENLLDKLKVPREVGILMVNGKLEKESYLLQDGERIGIFSPIGFLQRAPSDEAKQGAFEAILPSKPAYIPV